MSRDQGPQDCCTYDCNQGRNCPVRSTLTTGNGGNTVIDGEPLAPRNQPEPTNAGQWLVFETVGDWLLFAGAMSLVISLSAAALIHIFF